MEGFCVYRGEMMMIIAIACFSTSLHKVSIRWLISQKKCKIERIFV